MIRAYNKHLIVLLTIIANCISSTAYSQSADITGYERIYETESLPFITTTSKLSFYHKDIGTGCADKCGRTLGILETDLGKKIILSEYEYINGAPTVEQIIFFDIDNDSEKEMILKLKWKVVHSGEGTNANYFDIFIYDNIIDSTAEKLNGMDRLKTIDIGLVGGYDGKWQGRNISYKYSSHKALSIKIESNIDPDIYASDLNLKGELEYKNKNYKEAIKLFKEVIEINPKQLHTYSNLSLAYYKTGEYEKSVNAGYRVILGTNDKLLLASSYYNIAKSLESQGKWKSALEAFEDAKSNRQHSAYDKGIKRMKNKL